MTANSVSGVYTVSASASGTNSASFSMTNTSSTGASIAVFSGSGQSATVGTVFTQPLRVKATDSFGNPVAGVTVSFAAPASGAGAAFAGGVLTALTGADGIATSAALTANTIAGGYVITASATGLGSLSFNMVNSAGTAASMSVSSGSGQSSKIGVSFANPLKVLVIDSYGNPVAGKSVTFATPGSGASASFAGGVNTAISDAAGIATSAVITANNTAGNYSVTASATSIANTSFSLTNTVFSVSAFEVIDGASLRFRFNDTIATSGLQINDSYSGSTLTEEADLVVKDSSGAAIRGSMIVSSDLKSLVFVKSGANFSVGTFSIKLRSSANAFRASDGTLLDGNSDGTPGGDYTNSFTVSSTNRTLTIPDVVRGPGQDLRVNPTDNGIPVKIDNGQDIYSFEMSINYDPNLINLSELVVASGLSSNLDITYNVTVPGRIDIVGISPAGLPTGAQTLFFIRGNVPNGALYRTKCSVNVTNLKLFKLDGSNLSVTVDSGLMLNSYAGDVTGDGRYNSLDALRIQRYLVNLDRWFTQYPLVDPVVIADVNGDARVNSLDSLYLQRYLVNVPVSFITAPPVSSVTQTTGLDPIIRLPETLNLKRGQTIRVPIEIYNSDRREIEISSFETAIAIDPSVFKFISVRTVGQSKVRTNATKGVIAFAGVMPGTKLQPGESTFFAWLTLNVRHNTNHVDSAINLLDEISIGRDRYQTSLNSGDLILIPAPTASANDDVDSRVIIQTIPTAQSAGRLQQAQRALKRMTVSSVRRRFL
jgi:hypothetical protein